MKKFFSAILFTFLAFNLIAQTSDVSTSPVSAIVEEMPQFPGGDAALNKFLSDSIRYPKLARESNIEGLVVVQFIVDADGKITNVHTLRDLGGGCGEEAIRVVLSMPQWRPGKQNGKPVAVQFNLPIHFALGNDSPAKKKSGKTN